METIITRSGALRSLVKSGFTISSGRLARARILFYILHLVMPSHRYFLQPIGRLVLPSRPFERVMPSEAIRVNWRDEFLERELSYFLCTYSRANKVETSKIDIKAQAAIHGMSSCHKTEHIEVEVWINLFPASFRNVSRKTLRTFHTVAKFQFNRLN